MNNFNIVLAAIRKQCVQVNVPNNDCFEYIKSELHPNDHQHLDLYLDFLQDLGLIVYNRMERQITLTEQGRNTPVLFR